MPDELQEIIYEKEHKMKMRDVLDDVLHQEIDVAEYDDNGKFKRWITFSQKEYTIRWMRFMKEGAVAWVVNSDIDFY